MQELQTILELSSGRHKHLCPRQVLGARIGLAGIAALGLDAPRNDKRLLILVETDGCFADGIEAATGCTMGHRTLRLVDYGKIAATFVDVKTETAVRVSPQLDVRHKAYAYAPEEKKHYYAQLVGYQHMPTTELLTIQPVRLSVPVSQIVSRAGVRVNCANCGEEIINEREVVQNGQPFCAACVGQAYYVPEELLFGLTCNFPDHLPGRVHDYSTPHCLMLQ
ncbi:MAG: FmdE family protein [Candidatus Promineifilaceae bacterium]